MKLKPRVELRWLAIVLAIVAVVAFAIAVYCIPSYLRFRDISWDRVFRTEALYHAFAFAFGSIIFGVFPGVALLSGLSSWLIFKHLDKVLDEKPAA